MSLPPKHRLTSLYIQVSYQAFFILSSLKKLIIYIYHLQIKGIQVTKYMILMSQAYGGNVVQV